MPVQFDDYENHANDAEWTPRSGSNAQMILSFLLEHSNKGFTPSEIAKATEIRKGSVGPTLQRLEKRDLVRHKEPYWAISTDDRLAAYEGMLLSMEALDERYGDEGWAAVDRGEYEADEDELEDWRASQRHAKK